MDMSEAVGRSWRRIAYKLRGEGLWFHLTGNDQPLEALLIGTTESGFLVFDPESSVDVARVERVGDEVRLTFDHRVLDGRAAARALRALEEVLDGPVRSEVMELADLEPMPGQPQRPTRKRVVR